MAWKPLKGKIVFGGTTLEDAKKLDVTLNIGNDIDYVNFILEEADAEGLELNSEITVYVDTTDAATKKFAGKITNRKFMPLTGDYREVWFEALDWTHFLGIKQIVEIYFDMEISLIIKAIIDKYYPGITYTNVEATSITLAEYPIPYRKGNQVFDALAKIVDNIWFIDENKDFHFKPKSTGAANYTLTKADIVNVGKYEEDLLPVVNHWFVIGGKIQRIDQKAETESAGVSMHDNFYAVKFVPLQPKLDQAALKLEKVGAPTDALVIEIREDYGGDPLGATLKALNFPPTYVGSKDWYRGMFNIDVVTGRDYWIVARKVGDASNTYKWWKDALSTGKNAYSADGVTWTVQSSSFNFLFRTFYGTPIIAEALNAASIAKYEDIQDVFQDHAILSYDVAEKIAQGLAAKTGTAPESFDAYVTPDRDYSIGQVAAINYPELNLNNDKFVVMSVSLPLKKGFESAVVKLKLSSQLGSADVGDLAKLLRDILADLRAQKIKTSGVGEASVVDLIRSLSDSYSLGDSVDATTFTPPYKIGAAKIGFSCVH